MKAVLEKRYLVEKTEGAVLKQSLILPQTLVNTRIFAKKSQEKLKWADHIVWIYPVWWGSVPAIMKGFLDRVLLPGFAFKKREGSVWWDKYFTGKTARIICTMDQPTWYYRLINRGPSHNAMKRLTMNRVCQGFREY